MPGFRYIAVNLEGRETRGVLESDSPRLARTWLREQGLFPIDVSEIDATSKQSGRGKRQLALSTLELARLTRQLATLLSAGLTVEQMFDAVIEQAESETERQLLAGLRAAVLEGQSLGEALARYPAAFSDLYRTLVMAGETSGKLPEVLLRLADHVEEQQALHQKLILAMIYPAIVLVVSLLILTGLMVYVVPQVVGVFENTRQVLPLMTRALLAFSKFIQTTGLFWLGASIALFFGVRSALARETIKHRWHQRLLTLPLIGRFIRSRESAQLAATLSILVGSGVPVLTALNAATGVLGNLPMRSALQRASNAVREGSTLARALGQSKLFPPVMVHLIASGEASGRLTQTLATAARQQQNDVQMRISTLAALVEPALILGMGVMVLCIVLAILLPIFELNQLVR